MQKTLFYRTSDFGKEGFCCNVGKRNGKTENFIRVLWFLFLFVIVQIEMGIVLLRTDLETQVSESVTYGFGINDLL